MAMKLLIMLIVFIVVLGAGIVSKGSLFFMLAQMKVTLMDHENLATGKRPLKYCQDGEHKDAYVGVTETGSVAWQWYFS